MTLSVKELVTKVLPLLSNAKLDPTPLPVMSVECCVKSVPVVVMNEANSTPESV